jgi:hypothetical protein
VKRKMIGNKQVFMEVNQRERESNGEVKEEEYS